MQPNLRETMAVLLKTSMREAFSNGSISGNERDMELIQQLCLMTISPTGKEKPREILSDMSDSFVRQISSKLTEIKSHPVVGPICQMCFIEWCYRNDYLNDDWFWTWDSPIEGHISYASKTPLDQISLPDLNL